MKTMPLAATLALLVSAGAASALDLTVEVTNARSAEGYVAAALYADAGGWLKDGRSVQATRVAAGDKVVLVYRGLEPGRYALTAMHDENANGKLDTNVIGLPTERFGFSRDARAPMGPPAFDAAAFALDADQTIQVTLK